jgi:hypothetical protein
VRGTPKDKRKPVVWDVENNDARMAIHRIAPKSIQERMFNNKTTIGHDKFAVYVKNGVPTTVMTGSTNWTETGLCTQSNNAIIIEDTDVAKFYFDFWHRLAADPQPKRVPLTVQTAKGPTAASVEGVPTVAIADTWRLTRSAAIAGSRSYWPCAQRYSIVTFRPST